MTEEMTNVSDGENEEIDEQAFHEIDKLEQHGINVADINKLKASGLCTVLSVMMWYFSV